MAVTRVLNSSLLLCSTAKRSGLRLKWKRNKHVRLLSDGLYCTDAHNSDKTKSTENEGQTNRSWDDKYEDLIKRLQHWNVDDKTSHKNMKKITNEYKKVKNKPKKSSHKEIYNYDEVTNADLAVKGEPVIDPESCYQKMVKRKRNEALTSVLFSIPIRKISETTLKNACSKYGKLNYMCKFQVKTTRNQNSDSEVSDRLLPGVDHLDLNNPKKEMVGAELPGVDRLDLHNPEKVMGDAKLPGVDRLDLHNPEKKMVDAELPGVDRLDLHNPEKKMVDTEIKWYVLVEYRDREAVETLLNDLKNDENSHHALFHPIPLELPQESDTDSNWSHPPLEVDHVDLFEMKKEILAAESLNRQIHIFNHHHDVSEISIRLRYYIGKKVEEAIQRVYPCAEVCVNGSSISGLGLPGNDLDMSIQFIPEDEMSWKVLPVVAEKISESLPINNVLKLFHPRVPLIKFIHSPTGIMCDLKLWRESDMATEMMYLLGKIEPRFPMLVKMVKWLAKQKGITDDGRTRLPRSYSLTMLVIIFLQNTSPPVLPPLQKIFIESDDGKQYSFEDINKLEVSRNEQTLDELLLLFLDFRTLFYYKKQFLVPFTGDIKNVSGKRNSLYITDPLNRFNNVSRNVTTETFLLTCRQFRKISKHLSRPRSRSLRSSDWGLGSYVSTVLSKDHVTKNHIQQNHRTINRNLRKVGY